MPSELAIRPGSVPDIDSLLQPQLWTDLNPTLTVVKAEGLKNIGALVIDKATGDALDNLLINEGYFHIPQPPWNLPLGDMAQAIVRLCERGFVPPFCFIYDEFWLMYIKLKQMLGRLLGETYMMLPDFWAWFVDPRSSQSGWKPHRDMDYTALFPDRRPKALTVWISLTEATPLNGCIYIVPAHLDPTYGTPQDKEWRFQPQDIRALPSPAGGLFMWTQAAVHWGSHSSPLAAGPRISIAVEFQRGDVPPMNQPLIPPLAMLTLNHRLKLICKQILQYQHMYPLAPELRQLAEQAMKHPG